MPIYLYRSVLAASLLAIAPAELFLHDATVLTNNTRLSPKCIEAMSSSIDCDPALLSFASVGYVESIQSSLLSNTLCHSSCVSSLAAYRKRLSLDCSTVDAWPGLPASYNGDFVQAYQNQMCLKDTSGGWCNNILSNITQLKSGERLEDLPKAELCSPCMIATLRQSQSSSFSGYDEDIAKSWGKIQSLCSIEACGTSVPRPASSVGRVSFGKGFGLNTTVSTSTYEPQHCHSQQIYTVTKGDTCRSISEAIGVSTGALQILNDLYADCSNIITGADLCLPRTCKTYLVKHGDTCHSIRKAQQLSIGKLASFNPTINRDCTNLIVGDSICLSPPGGYAKLRGVPSKPKAAAVGAMNKQSVDSTETAKVSLAMSPVGKVVPLPTPSGITDQCLIYTLSKPDSSCDSFAKENDITAAQLYAWNSVFGIRGENCNEFEAGMHYCTGVSGPMRAPGPFQRGVVDTCVRYAKSTHADARDEQCAAFALRNGVALLDLYAWNTILKSACRHFLPDEYYCVAVAGP